MGATRDQVYDEFLVLRSQEGDTEGMAELIDRWQKRLWLYAKARTGREDAAWDVTQETWLAVVKGIGRLGDAARFRYWVYSIVSNKCVDWHRQHERGGRLTDNVKDARCQGEESSKIQAQQVDSLHDAILMLSEDQRAVVSLHYLEGFDVYEIAEILGVPGGTVKSRLHYARLKLRELIDRS